MTGAVIVLSLNTLNRKMVSPYGWWGYAPAPVTSATKEPPYEMLKNLRVGVETYDLLTTIKDAVNTHSSERDDVYFLPAYAVFLHHARQAAADTKSCAVVRRYSGS